MFKGSIGLKGDSSKGCEDSKEMSWASIKGMLFEGFIGLMGDSNKGCEGSKERNRASIKERLFKGSIGIRGDSMVYFFEERIVGWESHRLI